VLLSALSGTPLESNAIGIPAMSFHFESVAPNGALLRSLGKPAVWRIAESPHELFAPALQHARQLAIELASGTGALPMVRVAPPAAKTTARKTVHARKPRAPQKDS
jgi:hypothetical protein